jgi:hypothetical protein
MNAAKLCQVMMRSRWLIGGGMMPLACQRGDDVIK